MSLDMYGYTMNAEFVGDRQTDVNVSEDERDEAELNQFAYWRKFTVRLELEDLERLEADLNEEKLEHTPGFFFGDSQIYPDDITETKTFIANARLAIAEGRAVFYDSWW